VGSSVSYRPMSAAVPVHGLPGTSVRR
jgi:hypothetical protein